MEVAGNHKFKNEATRRFHDYVYQLSKKSDTHRDKVYKVFGLDQVQNPSNFFTQMRNGIRSVTLDQIYISKEKLGFNPGYLFETSDQEEMGYASSLVEEPDGEYGNIDLPVQKEIGKKVDVMLRKHKIKIEPYAKQRLGISKQAMYDKLKGKSRMFFDEVQLICEDLGESMDQFRRTPLPKGHHLQQMEVMNAMIEMLKSENAQLKKQVKAKK